MLALTGCFVAVLYLTGLRSDRNAVTTAPVANAAQPTDRLYRGHTAEYWAQKFRWRSEQYRHARAQLRQRWEPTVTYALRLASAVFGVPYWELSSVSRCESNHFPGATNGRYKGLFQLGWSPFGLSPFDPVANALSAAQTVRADGSWRQWECQP